MAETWDQNRQRAARLEAEYGLTADEIVDELRARARFDDCRTRQEYVDVLVKRIKTWDGREVEPTAEAVVEAMREFGFPLPTRRSQR